MVEEPKLSLDASSVPAKFSSCTDDAVAGDDDDDFVGCIRSCDGSVAFRIVDRFCDFGIASRFSDRNVPELLPDFSLERGSLCTKGSLKVPKFPFEVEAELLAKLTTCSRLSLGDSGEFFVESFGSLKS